MVSLGDHVRVVCDHNLGVANFGGHALKRFLSRMQVAAFIIDDRCQHVRASCLGLGFDCREDGPGSSPLDGKVVK